MYCYCDQDQGSDICFVKVQLSLEKGRNCPGKNLSAHIGLFCKCQSMWVLPCWRAQQDTELFWRLEIANNERFPSLTAALTAPGKP